MRGVKHIGRNAPISGNEYNGDLQVLKVFNTWECASVKTYSGKSIETGCDLNDRPGQFEISAPGTYFLLFRSGGASYGDIGVQIDKVTLEKVQ